VGFGSPSGQITTRTDAQRIETQARLVVVPAIRIMPQVIFSSG
jgi:hypothetical protein